MLAEGHHIAAAAARPLTCQRLQPAICLLQQGVLTLRLGDLGTYVINKQVCGGCPAALQ